jgi:hypothetical protein
MRSLSTVERKAASTMCRVLSIDVAAQLPMTTKTAAGNVLSLLKVSHPKLSQSVNDPR